LSGNNPAIPYCPIWISVEEVRGFVSRGNMIQYHLQQEALLLLAFSVCIIIIAVDIILLVEDILVIFTTSVLNLVQNCFLKFKNIISYDTGLWVKRKQ
jgi:ribose/xylose/arabinose/galactoside ABC-type transport system permease subunit